MDAYDMLFRRYYPPLCAYACQYVNEADAENAVQDVMLWLWEKRNSIIIRNSVSTYLYHAVKNHCMTLVSRNIIKEKVISAIHEAMREKFENPDFFMAGELQKKFNDTLEGMPEHYRTAFIKSRFDNMTYKEIAAEEGLSPKTIEYRIYQAIRILQTELKDWLPLLAALLAFNWIKN